MRRIILLFNFVKKKHTEMKSDLEYGNYRGAGMGGSLHYNSTDSYTATAGNRPVNMITVDLTAAPTLSELEDEDGDCMAAYGFGSATALSPGKVIGARRDKPFTKITFSVAGAVTLWRD